MSSREQAAKPALPARLRSDLARRLDTLALKRARTLAGRVAHGRYPEPRARRLRHTFTSLEEQARKGLPTKEYVERIAKAYARLWDRETGAILPSETLRRATIDQFHRIYYHSPKQTWRNTFYRGVPIWKCPLDLWLYQEILHEVRPDLIVETGTAFGGSAYYLADLCGLHGRGEVVSIDVKDRTNGLFHPRVTFLIGSSTDPEMKRKVLPRIPDGGTVLVILDSLHTRRHVLAEMRLWNDLVSEGSYLIVEDTNINGHPVGQPAL